MDKDKDDIVFIYTTFAAMEQARALGENLVLEKLAACVNIFPGMVSLYEWEEQMQSENEVAMIIKTRRGKCEDAFRRIGELHPYDTPAILVLPVEHTEEAYKAWLISATGG